MIKLSKEQLDNLLLYMHINPEDLDESDLEFVQTIYASKLRYLDAAGAVRTDENAEQFDMLVNAMVLFTYDHREDNAPEPLAIRQNINQLKMTSGSDRTAGELFDFDFNY